MYGYFLSSQNGRYRWAACSDDLPCLRTKAVHSTLAHERLLLAEDEPIIAMDLQQLLEKEGATVFPASSVPQALRLTETSALSAAVIDV
jgi:hypothetical protein